MPTKAELKNKVATLSGRVEALRVERDAARQQLNQAESTKDYHIQNTANAHKLIDEVVCVIDAGRSVLFSESDDSEVYRLLGFIREKLDPQPPF